MHRSRPSPVRRLQQPDRDRARASRQDAAIANEELAPPPFSSIAEPPSSASAPTASGAGGRSSNPSFEPGTYASAPVAKTTHDGAHARAAPRAPESAPAPAAAPAPETAPAPAQQDFDKYEVFRPRYPTLRPDSTLDVTLALCLARVPSELTAVHVDQFDVVPDITAKHDIRPDEIVDVSRETTPSPIAEASKGFVRKHFQLKSMRSNIRKQRAEAKVRVAESEDVIKAMFARLNSEGRPKTSMSVTVNGLDGSRYEHVMAVSGLDRTGQDSQSDSSSPSDDEDDDGSDSGVATTGKHRHGFIKTPPSGAFTNIVHMAVRGALVALQMNSSIGARSEREVVWNLLRSSEFQREFMVRCISLSAKYNEEKRHFKRGAGAAGAGAAGAESATSRIRLKTARRDLGHVPASYVSRRFARHAGPPPDPQQHQLPRPPMAS